MNYDYTVKSIDPMYPTPHNLPKPKQEQKKAPKKTVDEHGKTFLDYLTEFNSRN